MRIRLELLISILCLSLFSCRENPQKKYEKAVMELSGKTILFPDSMRTIFGEKVEIPNTEYTIVAYYDSVGCTGCRMNLPLWNDFISYTDSIFGKGKISLILFLTSHKTYNIKYIVNETLFKPTVIDDRLGVFKKINSIPDDSRMHTFLINSDKRIVLIGNPTQSNEMRTKFLNILITFDINDGEQNEFDNIIEFNFGNIKSQEEVFHIFHITNTYPDTLFIKDISSSCECVSANLSDIQIASGKTFNVVVSFKDSIKGDFIRTVTLKYQDSIPEQILEISGTII